MCECETKYDYNRNLKYVIDNRERERIEVTKSSNISIVTHPNIITLSSSITAQWSISAVLQSGILDKELAFKRSVEQRVVALQIITCDGIACGESMFEWADPRQEFVGGYLLS